jgi:Putative Flp pilus-assembly TadE/G-like
MARGRAGAEDGQLLVLLVGLVMLVLLVLALGWDTSNWFLGHRALVNLADGAAVAAAGEMDTAAWYASGGREVRVAERRARATVAAYLAEAVGDSGVAGVRPRSVVVGRGPGGRHGPAAAAMNGGLGVVDLLRLQFQPVGSPRPGVGDRLSSRPWFAQG